MLIYSNKFLVLGVSKSGFSASSYLLSKGAMCYVFEENDSTKIKEKKEELISKGAILLSNDNVEETLKYVDVVIISPGVPINHNIAVKARNLGKRIISELEFGYFCSFPKIVGVTGTNGKTTTVSLINSILSDYGAKCLLMGNVGCPVCDNVDKIDSSTVCVTEISSYQLESTCYLRPDVACILNVSPDHLERHYSMENYIFLKRRLLSNLTESEYAVLNFDDQVVKEFSQNTKAKIIYVSLMQEVDGGYKKEDALYYKGARIIGSNELRLQGIHNEYNALFAIVVAKLFGVSDQVIRDSLANFKGIPHRIQLISEKNEIKVYNDSKATNTASTISAINCMKGKTVLVLGGSNKGEDYSELFNVVKNSPIKHVVITGETKEEMIKTAVKIGVENFTSTNTFEDAVKYAYLLCDNGENLLFSPACASFDRFSGFEERGDYFAKLIGELSCRLN